MTASPDELRALARVMREEGIARLTIESPGGETIHLRMRRSAPAADSTGAPLAADLSTEDLEAEVQRRADAELDLELASAGG